MKQFVAYIALWCAFSVGSQAQATDTRLMTDADYKTFLLQVETALPKWETALKNIEPEKDERISYSLGKVIVDNRNLGLLQISNIRQFIAKQRDKRTVYGELALQGFLEGLFNAMDTTVEFEIIGGLTLSNLEKFAPELSAFIRSIANDAMARVALLEKGTCP